MGEVINFKILNSKKIVLIFQQNEERQYLVFLYFLIFSDLHCGVTLIQYFCLALPSPFLFLNPIKCYCS